MEKIGAGSKRALLFFIVMLGTGSLKVNFQIWIGMCAEAHIGVYI